ncbi:MAG: GNAT family N-acetyltransferase [Chloroflexi bacterium]|nr:GNAT family N-acetyltransferase [Chloroflexota bacterium]
MIRHAEENDFKGILRLLGQLNPEDPVIKDGRDKTVFNQILRDKNFHIFVLVENDRVISTCYLNIVPNITRNASPYGIIENVVTDSAFRKQGYGKKLIHFTLDYAWSVGCYKVMLQTGSRREGTRKFYESCGFDPNEKFAFVARPPSQSQQSV